MQRGAEVARRDSVNLARSGPGLLTEDNLSAMAHYTTVARRVRKRGNLPVTCVTRP